MSDAIEELERRCAALDPTAGLPGWKLVSNPPYWILDLHGTGAPWHCIALANAVHYWRVEWGKHRGARHTGSFTRILSPRKGMQQIEELLQDRSWLHTVKMEPRRPDIELGAGDDEDNDGACIWDVGGGFGIDFTGRVSRWNVFLVQFHIPEWALQRMDWLVTFDATAHGARAFIAVRDGDVTAPIWYATFTPETGWSAPELASLPKGETT